MASKVLLPSKVAKDIILNMKLTLNGEERIISGVTTLTDLVKKLDLTNKPIAVELNLNVVPKARLDATLLSDGDKVEIVQFVGGG